MTLFHEYTCNGYRRHNELGYQSGVRSGVNLDFIIKCVHHWEVGGMSKESTERPVVLDNQKEDGTNNE